MRPQQFTGAPYPFAVEKAFLGWATREPYLRYRFDGRRLVCWESWQIRVIAILAGAAIGPALTALLLLGKVKGPWYVQIAAGAFSLVAWAGWINALRHRYQVVFDLAHGEVRFLFHPRGATKYLLPFAAVRGVEIETIHRVRGRSGNPMRALAADDLSRGVSAVACHNLVLVRDDGLRIHVVESTDRAVVEAIVAIIERGLSDLRIETFQ